MAPVKEINMDRVREKLYYSKLDSGLEVFILPKKEYSKQYAIFATNFGSVDMRFSVPGEDGITEVPAGVAHFLEHKLFEEEEGNVFDRFSRLGASANAYTNFTSTAYLFSSTTNFYQCLEVLLDFVQSPHFTDENVEKEKGIISQEIRMYDDNGEWKSFFNMLQGLYHRHPVRVDIAGTVESISGIDKEVLYKCYSNFYHPDNMVLFVVGNIDINDTLELVVNNIKGNLSEREEDIKRYYPKEPDGIHAERIEQVLAVSQPIFNIGVKDSKVGFGGKELLSKDTVTSVLLEMLFGKSSALYQRLYSEGLIDDSFGFDFVAEVDYSYSMLGGESPDPDKLYSIIEKAMAEMKTEDLREEDFRLARNKLLGRYLRNFDRLEYIAANFIAYHFKGANFLDFIEVLEQTDLEAVKRRFEEHIKPWASSLSVVSPQ
ncbi:MAG: insulinase family protein [Clostridiales bacterium]|nr:insulinase family protein [Clostridiales bacterium]